MSVDASPKQGDPAVFGRMTVFVKGCYLFLSFLLVAAPLHAQNLMQVKPEPGKPKVGLVLAGGGALGIAHVGVLKVLQEHRIPVHVITGTSMGALVGAAFASGVPVDEMERILTETDWEHLFNEGTPRSRLDYRIKPGRDREVYGSKRIAIEDGSIVTRTGFLGGQHVFPLLQEMYAAVPNPANFDKLPVPFRAIAADIETGEEVVLDHGSLARAARSSMSVPGAFTPVTIDGRLLVDGGIVNNLPVDQAIALGADVILVVELYADLKKKEELTSPFSITGQMFSLLISQNSARQIKLMRPQDVLIAPDIKGYTTVDFTEGEELIKRGVTAAEAVINKLTHLSLSEEEFAAYRAVREQKAPQQTIDFIRFENKSTIPTESIRKTFGIEEGSIINREEVGEAVRRIYETGHFSRVEYAFLTENDGRRGIVIQTDAQAWSKQFFRIGAYLEDDFQGNAFYGLGVNYRLSELNSWGAYVDVKGEIGRNPMLETELFQPLGRDSAFFVAPVMGFNRSDILIRSGDDTIAEFERTQYAGGGTLGYGLPQSGEVRLGYLRGFGNFDLDIGDPALPDFDYDIGEAFAEVIYDTLDEADFPTSGQNARLVYTNSLRDLGASDDFDQLQGRAVFPMSFGRSTFIFSGSFAETFGSRPVERFFSLGGFFNVSGFERNSLFASDYWQGRLTYFRRFSEVENPFFGLKFFAGGALEYTQLSSTIDALNDEGGIASGNVFLGADTPVLPVYFGVGIAEEGNVSGYFTMGRLNPGRGS